MLENFMANKPKTVCPECDGVGWIITDRSRNCVKACKCLLKERNDNKLRFANLPPKYATKRLTDVSDFLYMKEESRKTINTCVAAVKEYVERIDEMQTIGKGIYMYSETKGTGKTLTTCAMLNELLEKGKQVKFADAPTILAEIKRTYENTSEYTENKLLDALVTAEILAIDDFGTEKVTDWVNDKFYQIINQRYVNKKVTIYTSNCELEKLNYDTRIISRITETCFKIPFPQESVREIIAFNDGMELKALQN